MASNIASLLTQIMQTHAPLPNSEWRSVMLQLQAKQRELHDYMDKHVKREIRFAGVSRVLIVDLSRRPSGLRNLRWRIRRGSELNRFATFDVVKSEVFPLITHQDRQLCEGVQRLMDELNALDSMLHNQIQAIQKRVLSAHKRTNTQTTADALAV